MKKILLIFAVCFASFLWAGQAYNPSKAYDIKDGIHKKLGLNCKSCHTEKSKKDYSANTTKACLNCHVSFKKLAEATSHLGYTSNVHASPHYPKLACDVCHKYHRPKGMAEGKHFKNPSTNYCASCHDQKVMQNLKAK